MHAFTGTCKTGYFQLTAGVFNYIKERLGSSKSSETETESASIY